MQKYFIYFITLVFFGATISLSSCKKDEETPGTPDPGESTTELLVKNFTSAPILDGTIDEMWGTAQKSVGTTVVPSLAARGTYLNSDGEGLEEALGLFDPFTGEKSTYKKVYSRYLLLLLRNCQGLSDRRKLPRYLTLQRYD